MELLSGPRLLPALVTLLFQQAKVRSLLNIRLPHRPGQELSQVSATIDRADLILIHPPNIVTVHAVSPTSTRTVSTTVQTISYSASLISSISTPLQATSFSQTFGPSNETSASTSTASHQASAQPATGGGTSSTHINVGLGVTIILVTYAAYVLM